MSGFFCVWFVLMMEWSYTFKDLTKASKGGQQVKGDFLNITYYTSTTTLTLTWLFAWRCTTQFFSFQALSFFLLCNCRVEFCREKSHRQLASQPLPTTLKAGFITPPEIHSKFQPKGSYYRYRWSPRSPIYVSCIFCGRSRVRWAAGPASARARLRKAAHNFFCPWRGYGQSALEGMILQ